MKYRVTEVGFIDRLVHVGEIIDVDGPPPIGGLVPVDDEPADTPVDEPAKPARGSRRSKGDAPPTDDGDGAGII